jgi:hypothetical protein
VKTRLLIIFSLTLLALAACEGATEPAQVPLPTVIFIQSGSPTPLLPPPSSDLTLTVQSTPIVTLTVTPPPMETPVLSPTRALTLSPVVASTLLPTDTPTPLPPTPAPTATSTPIKMCNIKVTNQIPCSITLAVAGTEFHFGAGEERVIEIPPGTYSYVISGACITDLRDKGEFPAGYWSWSPTIEYP